MFIFASRGPTEDSGEREVTEGNILGQDKEGFSIFSAAQSWNRPLPGTGKLVADTWGISATDAGALPPEALGSP